MRPARLPFTILPVILTLALPRPAVAQQSVCDVSPRVTTLGIQAAAGVAAIVTVAVVDPNDDAITSLTVDTSALPAGNDASFTTNANNTSGTLTWTPQAGQTGNYSVVFHADNAMSGSAAATIRVIDTVGAPFVQCPQSITFTGDGSLIRFDVLAGDPDGEPINSLTVSPMPLGVTFTTTPDNRRGTFNWILNINSQGLTNFQFTATSSSTASYPTSIYVAASARGPFVTAPASATGATGVPMTICVSAVDPDGDPINSLMASNLPAGASFTSSASHLAGTFSWTPSVGQLGTFPVTFTAFNSLGASATTSIQVGGDRSPIVSATASISGGIGAHFVFPVTASDPDGDAITSLTASGLPSGATFTASSDNTHGTFDWTPVVGQDGTYFVVVTAGANGITGSHTTQVLVSGSYSARYFTAAKESVIKLNSGKSTWCLQVESANGDFRVEDIAPGSVVMQSPGTGSVPQINAFTDKGSVIGDVDRNTIPDLQVCFRKEDLRQLFSNLTGRQPVSVYVYGRLTGSFSVFFGYLSVDVSAGGANHVASLTPNPPNPSATLRFTTSRPGAVNVRVFDVRGRLVRTFDKQPSSEAGEHALHFDGMSDSGRPLPSGIYVFRIETADGELSTKAAILR